MSGTGSDSDDLASDIVGVSKYAVEIPPKKKFLPWHKPRKQFVRQDQWAHYIKQLLDELTSTNGVLSYFGLPGVDFLDLRYLGSTVCGPRSLKLRFLGFNDNANGDVDEVELNVSYDELVKSHPIDPQSEVVLADFRALANVDSIAYQKTLELGPFDVINLDLCDGFGAKAPGAMTETYYNAVSRLLAIQARRKSPWLLLLTTRAGKGHVHGDTLKRLSAIYADNLGKCSDFTGASAKALSIRDVKSLKKAQLENAGLQKVFLVGLCKWLLKLGLDQQPPSIMAVKNVVGYRVLPQAEIEDMVSIAIRFDPTHEPAADKSQLASIVPVQPNECELATAALGKINKLFNIDRYLEEDTRIRDEMIEATCLLLEAARYDIDEYRSWLKV